MALTPAEMQRAVAVICLKLRDIAISTVHIVNPSKGEAYPMLNLLTERDATKPRLVLFPGWEHRARRRRITWKRQDTLMKRIHDAGVEAEVIEPEELDADDGKPFEVSLAVPATGMDAIIHDLDAYFGDVTRITVTTLERHNAPDLRVVKLYAPNSERTPRVVFYPGWTGAEEVEANRVDDAKRDGLRIEARRGKEVPIELFIRS
jgi:hypothetical protein